MNDTRMKRDPMRGLGPNTEANHSDRLRRCSTSDDLVTSLAPKPHPGSDPGGPGGSMPPDSEKNLPVRPRGDKMNIFRPFLVVF